MILKNQRNKPNKARYKPLVLALRRQRSWISEFKVKLPTASSRTEKITERPLSQNKTKIQKLGRWLSP